MVAFKIESKPLRTVLRWQLYTTAAVALVAGWWAGGQGALSALFGGLISWSAGFLFALLISGRKVQTAGEILRTALKAEAGKLALMGCLLWLVLSSYSELVPAAFFAAFVIAVLVSQAAVVVREG